MTMAKSLYLINPRSELATYFGAESYEAFRKELATIARGATLFECETVCENSSLSDHGSMSSSE